MDNRLILQLIKKDLEEIHTLITHFEENPSTLATGLDLARAKMESLNKEFEMIQIDQVKEGNAFNEVFTQEGEQKTDKEINNVQIQDSVISDPIKHVDSPTITEEKVNDIVQQDNISSYEIESTQVNYPEVLGHKLGKRAVSDIRSAIGINDRMLFIRELFNNSTSTYNRTIEHLNSQESYQTAIEWLNNEFHWDQEDILVQNFLNITKRKFK